MSERGWSSERESGLKIEIYVPELNEVNELGCLRWGERPERGEGVRERAGMCHTNAESEFPRE